MPPHPMNAPVLPHHHEKPGVGVGSRALVETAQHREHTALEEPLEWNARRPGEHGEFVRGDTHVRVTLPERGQAQNRRQTHRAHSVCEGESGDVTAQHLVVAWSRKDREPHLHHPVQHIHVLAVVPQGVQLQIAMFEQGALDQVEDVTKDATGLGEHILYCRVADVVLL